MTEERPLILSIDRCPAHGYWAISVGDEHGGTRLTPGKCCGRWEGVRSWRLSPMEVDRLLADIQSEAGRSVER